MRGRAVLAVALVGLPAAAPLSAARAATEICVGVVVDYRDLAGAPGGTSTHCAKVPNRSTGYEILLVRARALGRPPPRTENGLICGIDGLPERGCGESTGDGYRYWAYFHRTDDGSWQYSNRGASDYRVIDDPDRTSDDRPSEGWVWVDGGAEGSVRPATIRYDEICPPEKASTSPSPRRAAGSPSAASGPPASPPRRSSTAPAVTARSAAPATAVSPTGLPAAAPTEAVPTEAVPTEAVPTISPGQLRGEGGQGRSGLPVSTLAGIGVIVLVAAGAGVRLRTSNRSDHG